MLYLLTKGKDPIDHFKNNAWVASIYTFVMHMNSNQWRIQLVTSAHPQSQKKYITQEYILSNSVFCTTFTLFSLYFLSVLAFGSSLLPPSSFSSSSSSLPTRLAFDIFQAYKLSGNNPPIFILLQPRGSSFPIHFTFYFFKCLLFIYFFYSLIN